MASSLLALVAVLAVTLATAYPTTKDEEAYYYNRLRDVPDGYSKDVRNLDSIDVREDSRPLFALLQQVGQEGGSEKGSQAKYKLGSGSHLDGIGGGHLVRDLEPGQGGGNLLRDLDMLRNRAAMLTRDQRNEDKGRYHMDTLLGSTFGAPKRTAGSCCDSLSGIAIGSSKRNMDEIDRSSFNSFVKKNFDEIDRSSFGSFAKRNFDEIDRSLIGRFAKRSAAPEPHK